MCVNQLDYIAYYIRIRGRERALPKSRVEDFYKIFSYYTLLHSPSKYNDVLKNYL